MAGFNIKVDSKAFEKGLFAMRKQIPFAMSRAINATTKDCHEALINELPKDFTIRSKWVEGGIRTSSATKRDLTGEVGSITPFMLLQEEGGTKEKNKRALSIPVNDLRGSGGMGKLDRASGMWPKQMMKADKSVFVGKFAGGKRFVGKKEGPYQPRQRVTKRGGSGPVFPREPMKILYVFADSAKIKPRWDFWPVIVKTVDAKFPDRAIEAIDEAIRTAR